MQREVFHVTQQPPRLRISQKHASRIQDSIKLNQMRVACDDMIVLFGPPVMPLENKLHGPTQVFRHVVMSLVTYG